MPNHITNAVTFSGTEEKMKWFKDSIKQSEEEFEFDFNYFIPMPECLKGSRCPTVIIEDHPNGENLDGAISRDESERRKRKYDADNWYDWRLNNWGTKWGAYSVRKIKEDEKSVSLIFETAWSPPAEIFDFLVNNGIEVNGLWKDEGYNDVNMIGDGGNWCVDVEFILC